MKPEALLSRDVQWRPVDGWPYEVSNGGRVRNVKRRKGTFVGREPRQFKYSGYPVITICDKPRTKTVRVHQLVAEAFLGPRPVGHEINHIDGNPSNNHASNLEYVTHSENIAHAYALGLIPRRPMKLTEDDVREIRRRHSEGESMRGISRDYPVSGPTVRAIVRREKWKAVE